MMWWQDDGWSTGWMMVMMLGWVALLALGTWAVVALTRSRPTPTPGAQGTAREILDRRLAAGEITAVEYRAARELMESATTSAMPPS